MEETRLRGVHILVVDDEKDVRDTLGEFLVLHGANVTSAENGLVAYELIKTHKFDIILTDIRMPECSGLELVEKIRTSQLKSPPIIMMSAFTDLSSQEITELGIKGFIMKPHAVKNIVDLLIEAIDDEDFFS